MHFFNGFWENLCLFLVVCCMTVQSAIFYITKIVDCATFVLCSISCDLVSTNQILRMISD